MRKSLIAGILTVAVTGAIAADGYYLFTQCRLTDQTRVATNNTATSSASGLTKLHTAETTR